MDSNSTTNNNAAFFDIKQTNPCLYQATTNRSHVNHTVAEDNALQCNKCGQCSDIQAIDIKTMRVQHGRSILPFMAYETYKHANYVTL